MKKIKIFGIIGIIVVFIGLILMILAVTKNEDFAPISILVIIFGSLLFMPYRIILTEFEEDKNDKI